jgi:hypothetical protein
MSPSKQPAELGPAMLGRRASFSGEDVLLEVLRLLIAN